LLSAPLPGCWSPSRFGGFAAMFVRANLFPARQMAFPNGFLIAAGTRK
jgi:hypothetical protein